jgi:predicted RecB family nuclease
MGMENDVYKLKGIGPKHTEMLERIGVDSIKELGYQAESNLAVAEELVERAERQRDALQTLVEESVGGYMDLLYAPLSFYREGLQVARKATR